VGYFGSYARGEDGFGSDLDLVIVMRSAGGPAARRGLLFDTSPLPVPADILVYTEDELEEVLSREGRFARVLREETVWLTGAA
jgi:predicted nucleotidyltransferase